MATLYHLYRVRSHNKGNTPDGREIVFTGTAAEVVREYEDYSPASRCEDRFLVGRAGDDADAAEGVLDFLHEVAS